VIGGGQTEVSVSGICSSSGASESGELYDCTISGGDAAQFFSLSAAQNISIDATGELVDSRSHTIDVVGPTGYVFQIWKVGQSGFIYQASSISDPSYVPGDLWETTARLNLSPGTYGYSMGATCDTGYLQNDAHWCGAPIGNGGRPILNPYSGSWQAIYQFR
jgi:hypothetical protein